MVDDDEAESEAEAREIAEEEEFYGGELEFLAEEERAPKIAQAQEELEEAVRAFVAGMHDTTGIVRCLKALDEARGR